MGIGLTLEFILDCISSFLQNPRTRTAPIPVLVIANNTQKIIIKNYLLNADPKIYTHFSYKCCIMLTGQGKHV